MKKIMTVFMCAVLVLCTCSSCANNKIEEENGIDRVVYIAPTGSKFHFKRSCAGKSAKPVSYNNVKRYYGPCKKCTKVKTM